MHPRTLWSVARPTAIVVAAVASAAAAALVPALLVLPATPVDHDTTIVLGPVNVLPLVAAVIAAGVLVSSIAVFMRRPWGRSVLLAFLQAAGFASALVLVFICILLAQPGALGRAFLTYVAPSAAAFLVLSVVAFALAHFLRRATALRRSGDPPQSGLAA